MGKNIAAACAYLVKEAEVDSLYREVTARGWNIGAIPFVDSTSDEYISLLKGLRDSAKVVDTGSVMIHVFPGKDCKVKNGYIAIGVKAPIDQMIKFLEE